MRSMGMSSLSLIGLEVVLVLHTRQDPQAEEWDSYVELLLKVKKKVAGDVSRIRNIVVSDGGGPNAKQRSQVHLDVYDSAVTKITLLTNTLSNPLKRGLATAVSWLNPGFIALEPGRFQDGLRHVNLESQSRIVLQELERVQRQLPPVNSLALLVTREMDRV